MGRTTIGLLLAIVTLILSSKPLMAQDVLAKDSTEVSSKEVKNRNVLLNASSANQPREIPIGLPSSLATTIFEDGLPVSYHIWPDFPFYSWFGGVTFDKIRVLSISETALQYGSVGYTVDSYVRNSSEQFQGFVNYSLNSYGRQAFDLAMSGQFGKGWGYAVNTYQLFDPGSAKIQAAPIQNQIQNYKLKLDKRFAENRGIASLLYQHSSYMGNTSTSAPFIFVGDGSVKEYKGFKMGTDPYFPIQGNRFSYLDVETGKVETTTWKDGGTTVNNQLTFNLDYKFKSGNQLSVSSRYKDGDVNITSFAASGITDNTGAYYYQNGTSFTGDKLQNRWLMFVKGYERSWLTTATLSGSSKNERHNWRIGANVWWNRAKVTQQNVVYVHEVAVNPEMLYIKNSNGTLSSALSYNPGSGEYYKGYETKLALFVSDDWYITNRLWMSAGIRAELLQMGGEAAFNETAQDTYNNRNVGWHLKNGTARLNNFSKNFLNPSGSYNIRYNILRQFGLVGEYVYTRKAVNLQDYAGSYNTPATAMNVNMARAGIFFNQSWIQLVSQVSFINQTNNRNRTTFYHVMESDAGGYEKGDEASVTIPLLYNIQTAGWTTDVVVKPFKGFTFHGLITLQDPVYKQFDITATFPDGVTVGVDVSDKTVTAMSKCLVELNPSYSYQKWNVWLSFRYSSRQYINKTNTLYFNGWWESFGGVNYNLNKHINLGINVVNIFNQRGATGSISAADLITDISNYKNYLMSGSYIRPFELSASVSIRF